MTMTMTATTCSPARLAANRLNSLRSTGPRTSEGKARSRGNAYKHGMTGEGVARPEPGAAEVEATLAEVTGPMLARRVAVLADRLERLAEHDEAATARRVREAEGADDGGEGRHRELDEIVAGLADDPAAAVRRLRRSLAGVDRLLGLWDDLARDLDAGRPWTDAHRDRAACLGGRSPGEIGGSRVEALSATEGPARPDALAEIAGLVAAESAALRAHRATLPPADPALDRAEAVGLALFDPTARGALFRRYELATERNLYKALVEIRRAAARNVFEASLTPAIPPMPPLPPLASFGLGPEIEAEIEAEFEPRPRPPAAAPAPPPEVTPEAKKPPAALAAGPWIVPPTLPAGWEQNEAFGKNLLNFVTPTDQPAPRLKRPRLPRR